MASIFLDGVKYFNQSGNAIYPDDICPYHPIWITTFGEGYDEVKDRLGNMLLLPKQANKDIDTKSFTNKKAIYASSLTY